MVLVSSPPAVAKSGALGHGSTCDLMAAGAKPVWATGVGSSRGVSTSFRGVQGLGGPESPRGRPRPPGERREDEAVRLGSDQKLTRHIAGLRIGCPKGKRRPFQARSDCHRNICPSTILSAKVNISAKIDSAKTLGQHRSMDSLRDVNLTQHEKVVRVNSHNSLIFGWQLAIAASICCNRTPTHIKRLKAKRVSYQTIAMMNLCHLTPTMQNLSHQAAMYDLCRGERKHDCVFHRTVHVKKVVCQAPGSPGNLPPCSDRGVAHAA